MPTRRKHVKLLGSTTWAHEEYLWERGCVEEAHLREGKELVLVIPSNGYKYDVKLKRGATGKFVGNWECEKEVKPASAILYESNGNYLLFGEWAQSGLFVWWTQLSEVDHFAHETET